MSPHGAGAGPGRRSGFPGKPPRPSGPAPMIRWGLAYLAGIATGAAVFYPGLRAFDPPSVPAKPDTPGEVALLVVMQGVVAAVILLLPAIAAWAVLRRAGRTGLGWTMLAGALMPLLVIGVVSLATRLPPDLAGPGPFLGVAAAAGALGAAVFRLLLGRAA